MTSKFPAKIKNLLELKDKYNAFFFDMDGVYVRTLTLSDIASCSYLIFLF